MGAQKPGLSSFVKGRVLKKTRMQSSRLSLSSSHRGGGLSQCMVGYTNPWVWAWRPQGVGLETPPV